MAHILVVDDDDIIAELASGILVSAGHACVFVSDAAEAWRLLRWRRPDLLLLDEAMPGESGLSFLRSLRGSAEFSDLPVIMFTAQSGAEAERRALSTGAQDFVPKPVDPPLLCGKVDRLLQARAARPQHCQLAQRAEFQLRTRKNGLPRKVYL